MPRTSHARGDLLPTKRNNLSLPFFSVTFAVEKAVEILALGCTASTCKLGILPYP